MSIKMRHHMLVGSNEQVMCTDCKKVVKGLDDMYIFTVQVSGGSSEVTETLCKLCVQKVKK